ncbi:hypothetical protein SSIN_0741 [Streptococcus sinensis]|uniref:Uncharacterized protein n=1 Tax=Streptococcus sinensis TaxID=176090 RepID=A0A0A0DHD7_9STRE|nr:hypothetical protein SSIN_0741 [Streptococcus sinensis]
MTVPHVVEATSSLIDKENSRAAASEVFKQLSFPYYTIFFRYKQKKVDIFL